MTPNIRTAASEKLVVRGEGNGKWRPSYAAHLATVDWMERRRLVMIRARGVCEGCRKRKATTVHHLTYEHVGVEFLFELVAVCRSCHARLHPKGTRQ